LYSLNPCPGDDYHRFKVNPIKAIIIINNLKIKNCENTNSYCKIFLENPDFEIFGESISKIGTQLK
jgi:hypothetical protein